MITTLTSTVIFKNSFLMIYLINIFGFIPQVREEGFYDALVSNIPVQVLSALGIVAGMIWIARLGDNAWTNHKLNQSKAKIEFEKAQQAAIETLAQNKKLKDEATD